MRIIFLGRTPLHAALMAARIYLEDQWEPAEISRGWPDLSHDLSGPPVYIGSDSGGTEVYTLGGGRDLAMVKKSIEDLRDILGFQPKDLLVIPVSTRWDGLLGLMALIPSIIGGRRLNQVASLLLLRGQEKDLIELTAKAKQV